MPNEWTEKHPSQARCPSSNNACLRSDKRGKKEFIILKLPIVFPAISHLILPACLPA